MTHVTVGWLGWQASHLIAVKFINTPTGWTLCGFTGLCASVMPALKPLETTINSFFSEEDHCLKAMCKSIERAGGETYETIHHFQH